MAALLLPQHAIPQEPAIFSTRTNVVIVDVTVAGRDGKPIENLTKNDFELYEEGKLQQLQGCDVQRLDTQILPALKSSPRPLDESGARAATPAASMARDHRLMVLLFDFSSMQPTEQIRVTDAAVKFLSTQMTSSDLVSLMVVATSLQTVQDFTADRELLISTIKKLRAGDSSELVFLGD